MTTHVGTAEAQLSPGVTFRAPHGRKVLVCHPDEGVTPTGVRMRPFGRLCRTVHRRGSQTNRYVEMARALFVRQREKEESGYLTCAG